MLTDIHIEFTRPRNKLFPFFSYGIRLVENTKYSHVRLKWYNNRKDIWVVYEASGSNVKFKGPLAQKEEPVTVIKSYTVSIDKPKYDKLVKLCLENSGLNYGIMQIFGILLVKIFKLKKNPLSQGRKSQVCSEVVGRFLQEIIDIGHDLNLDTAGPKDIELTLESMEKINAH